MIRCGLLALMALLSSWPLLGATAGSVAVVQQPRPFGYVLGDTLTQRVLLEFSGRSFEPAALPPAERAGLWFARRAARIATAGDRHSWLVMDYQLINAPQALMTVELPSVTLKPKTGSGALIVAPWPISVGPLTPREVFAKGGLQPLRPDHPAPTLPTRALRRQTAIWSGALALTLVSWLTWWLIRSLRAAANQPFAQALREVRRDGDSPGAWLALHRAFDRTAHRVLQLSTLPALFEQAPYLIAERAAIERFYRESYLRFFGAGAMKAVRGPGTGNQSNTLSLHSLCRTLRRAEKQHEQ